MIEARNLRKVFSGGRGLEDFSLSVQRGELVGLVGPNGAGKTTLIKVLATLQPPASGSASVSGHDVVAAPRAVRAAIGYLPDVPGIYQDTRVIEFLEFFADAFRLREPRRAEAVSRALDRSGLGGRRGDFVEHLSLGWKQRLMLAKVLLHSPKLLLLDEPATGLDPLARVALRQQLKQLHAEGMTIVVSSHILSDLEDICTRVVFIADGRNVSEPSPPAAPGGSGSLTVCELSFEGAFAAVEASLVGAGARVLERKSDSLSFELPGGPKEASDFLLGLLSRGVVVLHFDARGPGLEERYRRTFTELGS
jgi:ABC-2 type transport system ATP-binding protein